jgi:hypothetical protein
VQCVTSTPKIIKIADCVNLERMISLRVCPFCQLVLDTYRIVA